MSRLREQVTEFHQAFGVSTPSRSTLPDDATVRLRMRLVLEEVFEFIEACTLDSKKWAHTRTSLLAILEMESVAVSMTDVADALADIDYVVEGARLAFGINGDPIAEEVHRANMTKVGGPIDIHGKRLKPPGWTPPRIAKCLAEQG
jgi:predicted HAD superfamily Cof-like phosphohydrolase